MSQKKRIAAVILPAALLFALLAGCGQETSPTVPEELASDPGESMASAADLIADIPTTQAFTEDEVAEEDIDKILSAGINAPSAMNGQNWHFTVVTDADVLQQIADGMGGGRPAGAPSTDEAAQQPEDAPPVGDASAEQENGDAASPATPPAGASGGQAKAGITDAPLAIVVSCKGGKEFDAGLACQNMSAEAQLLGYGTKIISSPTIALNGENQQTFRELLGIPDNQSAVAVLLVGMEDTSLDADAVTAATTRNAAEEVVTKVTP